MKFLRCNSNQGEGYDWDQALWGLTLPKAHPVFGAFGENQFLAVDIKEDDKNITVNADLPGLKKEEIHVSIENDVLIIRGERKSESEKNEKYYSRVERFVGVTERRLNLGTSVDQSKVTANYNNGVLELVLPKTESSKPRKIEIGG